MPEHAAIRHVAAREFEVGAADPGHQHLDDALAGTRIRIGIVGRDFSCAIEEQARAFCIADLVRSTKAPRCPLREQNSQAERASAPDNSRRICSRKPCSCPMTCRLTWRPAPERWSWRWSLSRRISSRSRRRSSRSLLESVAPLALLRRRPWSRLRRSRRRSWNERPNGRSRSRTIRSPSSTKEVRRHQPFHLSLTGGTALERGLRDPLRDLEIPTLPTSIFVDRHRPPALSTLALGPSI